MLVTITPLLEVLEIVPGAELTRDQARAILAAAGLLSTWRFAPSDTEPLSEEEREELAQLYGGEPSVSDMIIEARRERWD